VLAVRVFIRFWLLVRILVVRICRRVPIAHPVLRFAYDSKMDTAGHLFISYARKDGAANEALHALAFRERQESE
jgi:hypothetical protein